MRHRGIPVPSPLSLPLLLGLLSLVVTGEGARGQIPGGRVGALKEELAARRAKARARALKGIRASLERWVDAWETDGAGEISEVYHPAATLRGLPFGPEAGRDSLRRRFREFLPRAGSIDLNLREFDVSGRLAYLVMDFGYQALDDRGRDQSQSGTVLTVFRRTDGEWRIKSQLFHESRGDGASPLSR